MLDIDSVKAQGIIVKKAVQKDGFKVTCSMPWNELPGYFRGNLPKPGELIHVMMVRTNKTGDDKALHSAAVPLLYGGHNIFGYMKCTLTK